MSDEVYGGNYKPSPTKEDIDQMYDRGEIDHNDWIKLYKHMGHSLTEIRKPTNESNPTKQKDLENKIR
jgi:hypothetical protein